MSEIFVKYYEKITSILLSYIENISKEQFEFHFALLMALGAILCIYLLYSIYKRQLSFEGEPTQEEEPQNQLSRGLASILDSRAVLETGELKKKLNVPSFLLRI